MSGLCGWIGNGASAADNRGLIEAMAAPMGRFDASPVQTVQGRSSAVAVAAAGASAQLYQNGALTVALWGQAWLVDARMAQQAAEQGIGKTLADAWRRSPQLACASLSGAFVLAIIDEAAGEAMLAIDRMGTLPLSYQLTGEALVFGSSADAIARHPLTPARIDPQGIYNYVYFHMVPSPGTVHANQQRLLPGEYLLYRQGRIETHQYWRMRFEEHGNK